MIERKRIGRQKGGDGRGRPSKGPRYQRTIRFPEQLNDDIEMAATEAGYESVQDFVVDVLYRAKAAGLFPEVVPATAQERLPISA
jgi:hypothetical protein